MPDLGTALACCVMRAHAVIEGFPCVDPVSKGARQGIIISLVYLDDLLVELRESGVGCYWGSMVAGPFAYAAADDIVLLASSLAVPQL